MGRHKFLVSVLIGDELGLLKRLDCRSKEMRKITTLNRDLIGGQPAPEKSILSIFPLSKRTKPNDDKSEDNFNELDHIFLISSKPNRIYLYNNYTEEFVDIESPKIEANNKLVSSRPIDENNIVTCYENGAIFVQNIEKELLHVSSVNKSKAIKILGLELSETTRQTTIESSKRKINSSSKGNLIKNEPTTSKESAFQDKHPKTSCIFAPNWNPSNICITNFKVLSNRVAIVGKNLDLKIFDINSEQCIFTAKARSNDWLGLRPHIWVSDLEWIGPLAGRQSILNASTLLSSPSMVATCSRSDSILRIFDIKERRRKPVMQFNFKDQTFNNDSNAPSFTRICSTPSPHHTSFPTQQLILGTTMGRMMAVDLRFNSHSYRHLGVFKSFGSGAIRDIKYLPLETNIGKVVSCSLDRFVRIHSFCNGANKTREMDAKYYTKTKPTAVHPIISNFPLADISDELSHIDDSDME